MSTSDAISNIPGTTAATNAALGKSASQLDVNDFMTLMTAQLKNQDPLNPLDSTAFVAQLAQFGTVSGIQSMQASLSTLSDALRSSQVLSGSSLIGRQITAPADEFNLGATGTVDGTIEIPDGADSLTVAVKNEAGQTVRTLSLPVTHDTESFSWDGLTESGARAPVGTYTLDAVVEVGGTGYSPEVVLSAKVSSVTMSADGSTLTLNTDSLGPVALANVRNVM